MAIVLIKDALNANCMRTCSTKILDELQRVPAACYLAQVIKLIIEYVQLVSLYCVFLLLQLDGRVALDKF